MFYVQVIIKNDFLIILRKIWSDEIFLCEFWWKLLKYDCYLLSWFKFFFIFDELQGLTHSVRFSSVEIVPQCFVIVIVGWTNLGLSK